LTAGTGGGFISSRFAASVLALAALAAAFCFVLPATVFAQEQQERTGLLNRLFGNRPAYRVEDPPAKVVKPAKPRKTKVTRAPQGGADATPQVTVVTKRPDARTVLVIGDFLASGLAEGLTTAFVQNPNVKIVDRTSGSSGFVREDFHNWAKKADELISAERPAAVIVMIGTNDRQQMLVDGVRETIRSEAWNKEYAARAGELASTVAARKVPLLWVGMPPFKSSKMMLDVLAFNDIYRVAAVSAGGEFIDIWDGFADENGAFVPSGPDINGQPARLRANDGINLARPGKRKVAFYVEKPLYKVLGEDPAAGVAAAMPSGPRSAYRLFGPFGPAEQQETANLDIAVDPNEVGLVDPARPVALRTPALDGGETLLGAIAAPRLEASTPAEKLSVEGIAPAPLAGRADQFSGPLLASAATAMRQMRLDGTTNKVVAPSRPVDPAEDRASIRTVRSNVLTEPTPPMPARTPPQVAPDRLEEISPMQAAPDVAAAQPPMATPPTLAKAAAPEFAKGDPLDLSPARGAPQQAYKRPKSIGPEPNRAPTAVPKPVEDVAPVAEAESEIPAASAGETEPPADAMPARPDSAPPRAPAPSFVPGIAEDSAPSRIAPRKAEPVPVASLPVAKDAPSKLLPAPQAPRTAAVPNMSLEPEAGIVAARAVPSIEPGDITGSAPARAAPAAQATAALEAPARIAPSTVLTEIAPPNTPAAAALPAMKPASVAPTGSPTVGAPVTQPDVSVGLLQLAVPAEAAPVTPVAPAPPSVLPEEAAAPALPASVGETPAASALPELAKPQLRPIAPATPVAPAPPSVLPREVEAPALPTTPSAATATTGVPQIADPSVQPPLPATPVAPAPPSVLPREAEAPALPTTPSGATATTGVPQIADPSVQPQLPATPVAPAPPSVLPREVEAPALPTTPSGATATTGVPQVADPSVQPQLPAPPVAPAPPSVLPENAATPPPEFPGKEAALTGLPAGQAAVAQP